MEPTDFFEAEARTRGYQFVAGLDEAGRGPLAGPVVAAVVVLPRRCWLPGLNDSKQVAAPERERLYAEISKRALAVGVGCASEREIETLNIVQATRLAMSRAIQALPQSPDFLLIDALTLPSVRLPQRPIIKGDGFSVSIAAASIMAKVSRDRLMCDYHRRYPHYNFRSHKGYATPEHLRLLARHGPCDIHRQTFRPVLDTQEADEWEMLV
ncbi:MAG: ribonuclease HII [Nitrospiraceae bacterium]